MTPPAPKPDAGGVFDPLSRQDTADVARQLGRPTRGMIGVGHRCPCGRPDVVLTAPRLPDGSPFPTLYYLTCPRANSAIGTLEAGGLMARMQERLAHDPDLAEQMRAAHADYVATRREHGAVPEVEGVSAGGMPERVKCLHALAAHALARGRGVNPLGDEVLARLPDWWDRSPCVCQPTA